MDKETFNRRNHLVKQIENNIKGLLGRKGILNLSFPLGFYSRQIFLSLKLLSTVENSIIFTNELEEEIEILKSQARNNFLINCVSAFENFLKYSMLGLFIDPIDLAKSLTGQTISDEQSKNHEVSSSLLDWNGIIELLKLKLKDNFPILFPEENKDKIINPVFIIISRYSFQNLKDIDFVFTKVTGKPFLDEIENREAEQNDSLDFAKDLISQYTKETEQINLAERNRITENNWTSQLIDMQQKLLERQGHFILKKEFPDWREKIHSLFKLRNEFVHSKPANELSRDQTANFLVILDRLVKAVSNYLFEDFWWPSNEERLIKDGLADRVD